MHVNLTCPEIPFEIYSLASEDPDLDYHAHCAELWRQVTAELLDEKFNSRQHNSGTYDAGCRGPVCRKALRDHPKRRAGRGIPLAPRDERMFDPVIEYYYTVLKYRIRELQTELLKELKA